MPNDCSDIRGEKRALRQRVLRARDAADAALRAAWSAQIAARLLARPELASARTVHLFAGFGSEVDTLPLVDRLLQAGRRPVLPAVVPGTRTMRHAAVAGLHDLAPGFRGIREPAAGCPSVEPGELDLVIVPGVAFDRRGCRLGYGGGFYDRFLAACRAPRIAAVFALQLVDAVPCEACDLPVDVVITEREELHPRGRGDGAR